MNIRTALRLLWADRVTGAAIFACAALLPFLACLGD
jgi:hypothetical protein